MDSEEAFAESNENRDMKDGIGSQLMQLQPIDKEKTAEKIVDGGREAADEMVNKTNPLLDRRLRVAFFTGEEQCVFLLHQPELLHQVDVLVRDLDRSHSRSCVAIMDSRVLCLVSLVRGGINNGERVEAAEKVLFATHYLPGPARAWWNSTRAMNAGQMMTWEDLKLKFSRYHVPPGLIKKMRDEFRELKQGRMSVVEYRDRFLILSRYAPDETNTNEKKMERFLNGQHDEMQTVLVNIPFADLEALVDSAIQMEGKLHQANENCKRRIMH
ncbi:hypothetical protein QYE76_007467 [Lolium multiflorum]|uniref:Retrotransposon gag domain-containing protein n=1 Tax=Lolium multiflorum TaxID=4521 RepID=A0AAD8W373_LOLMU|nr:hypothetical protein QYE76_007467 [Lolium multiflorum]